MNLKNAIFGGSVTGISDRSGAYDGSIQAWLPIKDIVRLIIKSGVETGTPFTFNRDLVNRANPNSHKGIIYCSNLCTEIAQNMSRWSRWSSASKP